MRPSASFASWDGPSFAASSKEDGRTHFCVRWRELTMHLTICDEDVLRVEEEPGERVGAELPSNLILAVAAAMSSCSASARSSRKLSRVVSGRWTWYGQPPRPSRTCTCHPSVGHSWPSTLEAMMGAEIRTFVEGVFRLQAWVQGWCTASQAR